MSTVQRRSPRIPTAALVVLTFLVACLVVVLLAIQSQHAGQVGRAGGPDAGWAA